jgi:hypothetical protein
VNESVADFERALALDPELVRAKLGLAIGLIDRIETFGGGNGGVDLPRTRRSSQASCPLSRITPPRIS